MRFNIYPMSLLLVLFLATSCMQTREFQNKNYQKVEGEWYLVQTDGETKLPIIKNTITLKYNKDVTDEQIKSFESEHGLKLLRKAKTGWHDYEVSDQANVFDIAMELEKAVMVAALEIPTGGSY